MITRPSIPAPWLRRVRGSLGLALVVSAAACGDDGTASESDSATGGETTTTTATTTTTTTTTTGTGTGSESESASTDPVTLSGVSESETGGCPPDTVECEGACVDVKGDPNHCGACGEPCAPGESCDQGMCVTFCERGLTECGGACVDTDVDPDNCGACGNTCGFDEECLDGACVGIEVCDGVDNNNDGAIDEGFPDSDMDGAADCVDLECDVDVVVPTMVAVDAQCVAPDVLIEDPWNVKIEWQWKDGSSGSYVAPVVGNLTDDNDDGVIDSDDTPDIAVSLVGGQIAVLDGASGSVHWTKASTSGQSGVLIADVDADGKPDVVGLDNGKRAIALDGATGAVKWTSTVASAMSYPLPTVADVDADGVPEVLMGEHVLNGEDGTTARTYPLPGGIPYWGPTAADLDQDGDQEIVIGNTVYGLDGVAQWSAPIAGSYGHWSMIINADDDPEAEVAMIGSSKLGVYNHDGSQIYAVNDAGIQRPGPPCVADFDGDGDAEMAWASNNIFSVYELNGTKLWSSMAIADSSGLAGCSGYDVNGDGAYEIIFADQNDLFIFDGKTGTVLFKQPGHNSVTAFEYPTVADVDKDGSAEIVYTSNFDATWGTLTILGHAGSGWMASGPTWGIHDFAVTNLLQNGKVPQKPEPSWQVYNVFRARPTVDDAAVDLTVEVIDSCVTGCVESSVATLVVQVFNTGGVDVDPGVPLTLYRKDGMMLEVIETVTINDPIPSGTGTAGVVFMVPLPNIGADGLVIRVDDDGVGGSVQAECSESNNEAAWDDTLCPG